jgi:hypothetical protein
LGTNSKNLGGKYHLLIAKRGGKISLA